MLVYLLAFLVSLTCCETVVSFYFECPYYTASIGGYATCSFRACGGSVVGAHGCNECTGSQTLEIYDSNGQEASSVNDYYCYPCESIEFTVPGDSSTCSTYTLLEGCDSTSSTSCTGTVFMSGTDYPAPASTDFTCLPYKNSGTCNFIACTGQQVYVSGCDACSGDQYLQIYVDGTVPGYIGTWSACDDCKEGSFFVPPDVNGNSQCVTYTLEEGCTGGTTCSGTVTVSGASECLNCTPSYKMSDGDIGAIVLGALYTVALCIAFAVQRGWITLDLLAAKGESEGCVAPKGTNLKPTAALSPLHSPSPIASAAASAVAAKPKATDKLPTIVLHKFSTTNDAETAKNTADTKAAATQDPATVVQHKFSEHADKDTANAKPVDLENGCEDTALADILYEATASQESSTTPAVVTEQPTGAVSSAEHSQSRRLTGSHRLSLEVTKGPLDDSTQYKMCVIAEGRDLFGIPGLKVKPTVYALVTLATQIFSLLSFLLSYGFSNNKKGIINACILIFTGMYLAVSWVAVPVWQNYTLHYAESRSSVDCAGNGCIFCRCYALCCGLCCHFGCQPTHFTARTEVTCRYIPLSVYNLVFMLRHPGKCINNELPADMPAFGFGRAYFLLMSINVRGAMYLYIFINAVVKLAQAADTSAAILAAMSLASAIVNLRLYVLSILLGIYFLPFTVMTMFLFCCTDRFNWVEQLQSKRGTRNFDRFTWVWEKVKKY